VSPGTSVASSHPGGAARGRGTTGGGRTGSPGGAERGDATLPGAGGSPAAPGSTGDGGGIPPEYDPYLQRFRHRVEESAGYPLAARREGLFGRVELEVLLDPSGRVSAVRVVRSSSHAVLDDAALDAVRSAEPEPFPAHLPRRPLRVRLPLAFELR
jgi:protein TonB